MNDPHVVHLEYRIACKDFINWSAAEAATFQNDDFTVEIKDQRVVFRFKTHYGSEEEAKSAIESYRKNWEFTAGISRGPDAFTLRFVRSEIVDRNPSEGVRSARLSFASGTGRITANPTVCPARYPEPPVAGTMKRTPDIDSMYHRYLGCRAGKEPLPSMAYFCLTVLESMAGGRRAAAEKFGISSKVLKEVGKLSSGAGGALARKDEGRGQPYTPDDEKFLVTAIQRMILRAAEVAQDPDGERQQIAMDLIICRTVE